MTDSAKPHLTARPAFSLRAWLDAPVPATPWQARVQQSLNQWRRFRRNTSALFGLIVILFIVTVAIFAPWLATHDIYAQNLHLRLAPPDREYWLGTDELGRDIYSRLIYGARITLYITGLTALIVGPLGLLVGTLAGTVGGWTDTILMRIVDIFLAFPSLILALGFVAALGPGIENAIIAISLSAWPPIARLARAEALSIRKMDYVAAVRLQGASQMRIILRHIIPMCLPSVVVRLTLNMAGIILTASGLGFLGLGAQAPSPEWGAMLSSGRQFMMTHWTIAAIPGLSILFTSLAFNLFGDGLRDVLDLRHD
ncbi:MULTISPECIES: ABC transporter permease [Rahnella]|jgi:peptide/nickel transport system permease protein|uniref:ABC transporter permease n=1 Tax=Rahnella sp. (strain Y9602) TaxID=2703885 RepID=A0ABW6CGP9_RAHSY|nr:ABC transporter permease [Rahnella aceris]AYA05103.1 ABC transporter permease [Rahnella aquatilis]AZP49080.1 ABC transporter permease [Rahnella aquatilis]MBU9865265.1 ABC transporter permease [Rahnella aceris]MDP9706150.1 peptide/nickel transport system permease protein [Rahnella aquatilis]RKT66701.1 peptide/nickel transport system permease protein [Rahnella aquatilis]